MILRGFNPLLNLSPEKAGASTLFHTSTTMNAKLVLTMCCTAIAYVHARQFQLDTFDNTYIREIAREVLIVKENEPVEFISLTMGSEGSTSDS
uniref:AlNc14C61G4463 protein n=1 Tax=Albugo laibachii Nc14 TaxID=890382 RepID=F0WCT7_9STRA|nr:AlNc14C61G4463 [Albugo laibachii Nc14]|eukprot:CCA19006.1 AlNc14C61G4463 [Albugo laibachii Nc14]